MTWSFVIIPPIIVCCQSSLEAISAPVRSCSSNVGSPNALETPYCAEEKGPELSIHTHFDWGHSLARCPDRRASRSRGPSLMCLEAGAGATPPAELSVIRHH